MSPRSLKSFLPSEGGSCRNVHVHGDLMQVKQLLPIFLAIGCLDFGGGG